MYSKFGSHEGALVAGAARVLKQHGFDVARGVALSSSSTTALTRADLVGMSDLGTVVLEVKTAPTSGAALSAFFQTASLIQRRRELEKPIIVVLATSAELSESVRLAAQRFNVQIVDTKRLVEQLDKIVEKFEHMADQETRRTLDEPQDR